MAEIIIMPKLGFNMSVGKLVRWYKEEGDSVAKGEPVFAIETDKTNIDIEVTSDGVFRKRFIEEGDSVEVTLPIAIVAGADENIDDMVAECLSNLGREPVSPVEAKEERQAGNVGEAFQKIAVQPADGKIKITPRARKAAAEKGIDIKMLNIAGTGYQGGICEEDILSYAAEQKIKITPLAKNIADSKGIDAGSISGTGVNGKIVRKDVESAMSSPAAKDTGAGRTIINDKEVLEIVDYSGVRKIIGERLSQSFVTSPHVFFTQKINMEKLLELRKEVNKAQERKTSVTDYIAAAVTKTLQKYPEVNASLEGDKIIRYKTINLGIAVAAPTGLIVPVVKNAEKMTVTEISECSGALVEKARDGKLMPGEYTGGTFTISNLGMFGIENFTAIINPPEAGILAVSATKDEAVVEVDESGNKNIAIRPMMNIQLSADHRVVDGMLAAQFVGEVKRLLENPISLLLK